MLHTTHMQCASDLSVLQRCINAMNKSWHPDHFFCSLCGKPFEEDNFNFYEKDGKPYCKEDYFDQFAPTCKRCDRAVMGGYLSAVGSYWHRECFTCKVRGRDVARCCARPASCSRWHSFCAFTASWVWVGVCSVIVTVAPPPPPARTTHSRATKASQR